MTELANQTIEEFLANLASARPTPGGGSVAAITGALGAALGSMVGAIASRRDEDPTLATTARAMESLRVKFLELADQDAAAFDAVMAAYRAPKDDPTRRAAIDAALAAAAAVPLRTAAACVELLHGLNQLVPHATRQSVSDIGVAVRVTDAALNSALLNVAINLAYIRDPSRITAARSRSDELRAVGAQLVTAVMAAVEERLP